MAELNKLVSSLPIEERQNLLQRLKTQSNFSNKILYDGGNDEVSSGDIDAEYNKLPVIYHFWYNFLSFFRSKPPIKIFEESKITMLGNKIEEIAPGLYDCQKSMLLPLFFRQLTKLKEAAHFFYSALDSSVNRDKAAFFAFLGSLEMPDVHKALQNDTNPANIAQKYPEMPENELRQMAFKAMDDAFAMISEEKRNAMYSDARALYCLKELSSFLYDRVLMAFDTKTGNGETCSAGIVRDLLLTLSNILMSLKTVPPMTLLESLFIFILQERISESGFEINREIRMLLSKAEEALAVIQEFNSHVPLTLVLRCCTRNMSLTPHELGGGEDWYIVYRDYWKRRIDSVFTEYLKERRMKELMESFSVFFKGKELKSIENVQTDSNPDGMPLKNAFCLSFLYTFYPVVFMPDINWVLKPILIEGEFQKKENRAEFAEGYNNLIKLEDEIKKLEFNISTSGDYYSDYTMARQDMSAYSVKRRKIQVAVGQAEEDAAKILEQTKSASLSMINILSGILSKDSKGKYSPLINLPKVSGKNPQFISGVTDIIQKFQFVVKVMEDIEIMENGK
jgi:hypothetical protein